jgi:serine/threonine protein kinase/WD40 repeat protein
VAPPPQTPEEERYSRELSRQDFSAPYKPLIPGYELQSLLGQGAFAEVWEARQTRTQKRVALKVFKHKTGAQWLFLQRELERLSQLDRHPYVVSLLDADLTAEPPYYTMDLLTRGSLEKRVDPAAPLEPAQAARWMEEVCEALAYVHGKGLIHCDLKPANILQDDEGHVRVMDFGHSRILTPSSGTLGTLHYMAPEQTLLAEPGASFQPDLRWDLFALGASFHALLSGQTPWGGARAQLEALEHLRDKLRCYREAVAAEPLPDLHRLSRGRVDRDLAAIVARCASADPARRYASAAEVLDELKARRQQRPVAAAAGHPWHAARKFLRRNRTAASVAGVGVLVSLGFLLHSAQEKDRRLREQSAVAYNAQAAAYAQDQEPLLSAAYYDAANQAVPSAARYRNLQAVLPAPPRALLRFTHEELLGFHPDGERALVRGDKGRLRLFTLKDGKPERSYAAPPAHLVSGAFSRDGRLLAAGARDGTLIVFDADSGHALGPRLTLGQAPAVLAWSADARALAVGGREGLLMLWAWPGGKILGRASLAGPIRRLDWSADGRWLAVAAADTLLVRSAQDPGRGLLSVPLEEAGADWAWSPEGPSLLLQEPSGRLRAYSRRAFMSAQWGQAASIPPPSQRPRTLALAPGGSHALRLDRDGHFHLWQWGHGRFQRLSLGGLPPVVQAAVFDPAGTRVATLGAQGKLSVWFLADGRRLSGPWDAGRQGTALRWLGPQALLCQGPWGAQAWDPVLGQPSGRALALPVGSELSASPGGAWLLRWPAGSDEETWAYASASRKDWVYDYPDLGAGRVPSGSAAQSPDGRRLFSAAGSRARFWDLETGKRWGRDLVFQSAVRSVAYSPDSRWALVCSGGPAAILFDLAQGKPARSLDAGAPLVAAVFPAGALIAADANGRLWRWELSSGAATAFGAPWPGLQALALRGGELAGLGPHELRILSARDGSLRRRVPLAAAAGRLQLSADGQRVLALDGRELQLWGTEDGKPLGRPIQLDAEASAAALSPGLEDLAVALKGGGLRFYDAASGEALGPALPTPGELRTLSFSADGRSLAGGAANGRHRLWQLPWLARKARSPQAAHERALAATAVQVDEDGAPQALGYARWKAAWRATGGGEP